MTIEVDLKEIKSLLSELNKKLDVLLEERQVECEAPLEDEVKAIKEYTAAKKKKNLHLVSLKSITKGT
jgi:hypothetical protein